jgi:hypothetical protein
MKKIAEILGGDKLIKSIKDLIDEIFTNKTEKAEAEKKIVSVIQEYQLQTQSELTERLRIDMNSDSWLSKNIRPLTLVFILFIYSLFSVLDGNIGGFEINKDYVTLMGEWGRWIMCFYFGGRTLEKGIQTWKAKL